MRNRNLKMRYLHSVASFLIVLIISLPLYSSFVFAHLYNPAIKGEDGIKGYIKDEDTISISVNVFSEGEIIEPSQIHLYDINGETFSSCGEGYCYNINPDDAEYPFQNEFEMKVVLYDKDNKVEDSVTAKGVKDSIGPKITDFKITAPNRATGAGRLIARSEEITFSYKIEDRIYDGSTGKCTGIKELKLSTESHEKTIGINSKPGDCIRQGSFKVKADEITDSNYGEVIVRAVASDFFGQESPDAPDAEVKFIVDGQPPVIDADSFGIFDAQGNEVKFISNIPGSTESMKFSASVAVSDPSGMSSVKADFSNLKDSNGEKSAVYQDGKYIWKDILIEPSSEVSEAQRSIKITASDTFGNLIESVVPYNFEMDNTAPSVKKIKTIRVDSESLEGKSYLGKTDNKIIVELEEAGIGFSNKNVYLNLRNINNKDGAENTQADECVKKDALWECYWNIQEIAASDGSKEVSVKPNSMDDLGNKVAADSPSLSAEVVIDRKEPAIKRIKISPENPTALDKLTIEFDVEEASPFTSSVDSSKISQTKLFNAECTAKEGYKHCSAVIDSLITHYSKSSIGITAKDIAGNEKKESSDLIIYESETEIRPNFFRIKEVNSVQQIDSIPSEITREVASHTSFLLFIQPEIELIGSSSPAEPAETPAEIISKDVDCNSISGDLKEDEKLLNEDSDKPYILLKLNEFVDEESSEDKSNFDVKCTLSLGVKAGGKVYRLTEDEEITKSVPITKSEFGSAGDNAEAKLESVQKGIDKLEERIEDWEKWNKVLGIFCKIVESIAQVVNVIQIVKGVIGGIYCGAFMCCTANVPIISWICCIVAAILFYVWHYFCLIATPLQSIFNKNMWSQSAISIFDPTTFAGQAVRVGCGIYTCKFWQFLWNFAGGVGAGMLGGIGSGGGGGGNAGGTGGGGGGGSPPISVSTTTSKGTPSSYAVVETKANDKTNKNTNNKPTEAVDLMKSLPPKVTNLLNLFSSGSKGEKKTETPPSNKKDLTKSETFFSGAGYDLWSIAGSAIFGWDPYKSIHYSRITFCLPGMIYNWRKERQIKCMYRNCLKNTMEKGISTSICEKTLKERECLYVDSAQYKLHGMMDFTLKNLYKAILSSLPVVVACNTQYALCNAYNDAYRPAGVGSLLTCVGYCYSGGWGAWYNMLCGITMGACGLQEIGDFKNGFDLDQYLAKLNGKDYCADESLY